MKRICTWLIRTDTGNSIHRWRVLRFRFALGWGLLIAALVASQLYVRPDKPEVIIWGLFIWLPVQQLIYLRRTAAGLVISQKRMAEAGFNRYPITDRRKMARLFILINVLGIPIVVAILFAHFTK